MVATAPVLAKKRKPTVIRPLRAAAERAIDVGSKSGLTSLIVKRGCAMWLPMKQVHLSKPWDTRLVHE